MPLVLRRCCACVHPCSLLWRVCALSLGVLPTGINPAKDAQADALIRAHAGMRRARALRAHNSIVYLRAGMREAFFDPAWLLNHSVIASSDLGADQRDAFADGSGNANGTSDTRSSMTEHRGGGSRRRDYSAQLVHKGGGSAAAHEAMAGASSCRDPPLVARGLGTIRFRPSAEQLVEMTAYAHDLRR